MGSNGGGPSSSHPVTSRPNPTPHIPPHISQLTGGVKPSFSPLNPGPATSRLPVSSTQHQIAPFYNPGSPHYANLMKVFHNQNLLQRNQL